MTKKIKKLPKSVNHFQIDDPFAAGVAWCPGCALELNARFATRILGKNTILVGTPSCSAPVLNGQNTGSWHKLGHYACVMTGVASSATGLTRMYQRAGTDATVVCWTGDGGAQDIGFQAVSGAAERNEKMIYICYDNEGYMNTGVQRSSATPFSASSSTTPAGTHSKGKTTAGKDMPMLMAMHNVPYVATATLSHLNDYAKKIEKAKEKVKEGFVYLHVFCPCHVGWRVNMDASIEVCRRAVKTNYFPLWEAEHKQFRLTTKVAKPMPVAELTSIIGKFKHLDDEGIAAFQEIVDKKYAFIKMLNDNSELMST